MIPQATGWGPLRISYEVLGNEGEYLKNRAYDPSYRPAGFSTEKLDYVAQFEELIMQPALRYWGRALKTRRFVPGSPILRDTQIRACRYVDMTAFPRTNWAIEHSDVHMFILFDRPEFCVDGSNVLASAGPCAYDNCGRPIAGFISVCSNHDYKDLTTFRDFTVSNMIHEIAHVLFFIDTAFSRFRDVHWDGNGLAYPHRTGFRPVSDQCHAGCTIHVTV